METLVDDPETTFTSFNPNFSQTLYCNHEYVHVYCVALEQSPQRIMRLNKLRQADPAPITGLDALLINQLFFFDDPLRFTEKVNALCEELEIRVAEEKGVFPKGYPRVIVSGCPMAIPNWKVPWIIEASGAVIVGEESCVGERGTRWFIDESGNGVEDLMTNIVNRYFDIDCSIFTPNQSRVQHVETMFKNTCANGLIHYNLQFCQPYQIESNTAEMYFEKKEIPFLRLDTDYSLEDSGQIRTRVEAFLERIRTD